LLRLSDWKIKLIPLAYRGVSFIFAVAYLLGPGRHREYAVAPLLLLGLALVEMLSASLPPFLAENLRDKWLGLAISAFGITFCMLILLLSGSIESPFILYSLSPVLSSALFLSSKKTCLISSIICLLVILGQFFNPFFHQDFTPVLATQIILYIVINGLMITLPYVVNVNQKQKLAQKSVLAERQRLSRELHDGIAQTLHALCWQVQQVRHEAENSDLKNKDIQQLEELAEKARTDILLAMDALRNHLAENDFKTLLIGCLEDLKQINQIDYNLKFDVDDFNPSVEIKNELLSICREALANIRKHSGAHNVQITLTQSRGLLELTITDDGRGFDALSYYHRRFEIKDHHGLAVMRERAQLINGKLHILSLPQRGTEVKIEIPIHYARSKT
jgi:signal transduction histidine kinase